MLIRPATLADIPEIVTISQRGMSSRLQRGLVIQRKHDEVRALYERKWKDWMTVEGSQVYVARGGEEGSEEVKKDMLGYAWLRRVERGSGRGSQEETSRAAGKKQFNEGMDAWGTSALKNESHFYLEGLGAAHTPERRDVRQALVHHCVDRARAARLHLYTNATEEALPFWDRLGFKPVDGCKAKKSVGLIQAEVYLLQFRINEAEPRLK